MAENVTVELGGKSIFEVAYDLMKHIATVEKRSLHSAQAENPANRDYILDTYIACLKATRGVR